jgi:Fe-S-cluster-containing dehydrogenase component
MNIKKRYSLLIDLDKCVGCKGCIVACKVENNVDLGVFWDQVYQIGAEGRFPNLEMFYMPKQCMHCDSPLCVEVCPTKATYQTEDGIVLIDKDRCFGCEYCIWACPYGVRTKNKRTGMVEKCILCVHRITKAEKPACVSSCLGMCRIFGDFNDPTSEISMYYARHQERAFKIHADLGTNPSVVYLLPRKGAQTLTDAVRKEQMK